MILKNLFLHNFRNYEKTHINFSPDINIIIGGNGEGKTNLLEAIFLLATGKSVKTHFFSELIKKGEEFFFLKAEFLKDDVLQSIELYYDGKEKKIKHNQTSLHNFIDLLGFLPSVLYTPQDISLISGSPSDRRRFFNTHISQHDPLYFIHLSRFFQALKQRNTLLKSDAADSLFSPWEKEMAISWSYIAHKREEITKKMQKSLPDQIAKLTPEKEPISFIYAPSIPVEEDLNLMQKKCLSHFEKYRKKEKILKSTLCGPHRDDFQLFLHEKSAKSYASEGQKTTLAAAIRLSEWELLFETTKHPPLLLIDDFGSHLDEKRKKLLFENASNKSQLFITTPEKDPLFTDKNEKVHFLRIEKGNAV